MGISISFQHAAWYCARVSLWLVALREMTSCVQALSRNSSHRYSARRDDVMLSWRIKTLLDARPNMAVSCGNILLHAGWLS